MRMFDPERWKDKKWLQVFFLLLVMISIRIQGYTQDFAVYTLQHMSFGAFFLGNTGGTIEISADGSRTADGDVVPLHLGYLYHQAIFEIEAPAGTIISILNNAEVKLSGSNGGMLTWNIGNTLPVSPFITTIAAPGRTQVSVGGKLNAAGASVNPAGTYSGTISITFNQE
jgi:hypothetical protein